MSKIHAQQVQAAFLQHDRNAKVYRGRGRSEQYGRASDAGRSGDLSYFNTDLSDPAFAEFAKDAYSSEGGYAIRVNPNTGEKEMFIAGTRHASQWGLNAFDAVTYGADKAVTELYNDLVAVETGLPHMQHIKMLGRLDVWREQKQLDLAKIARNKGVDVIYGHSRGGAMAADLKNVKAVRIPIDAAMLIAQHTDTINLEEGGGWNPLGKFDEMIGFTGEKNVHMDLSTWSPHKVWAT